MGFFAKIIEFFSSKTGLWAGVGAVIIGGLGAIANAVNQAKRDKTNKDLGAAQQREKAQAAQNQKVQDVQKAGDAAVVDIRSGKLRSNDGAKLPD